MIQELTNKHKAISLQEALIEDTKEQIKFLECTQMATSDELIATRVFLTQEINNTKKDILEHSLPTTIKNTEIKPSALEKVIDKITIYYDNKKVQKLQEALKFVNITLYARKTNNRKLLSDLDTVLENFEKSLKDTKHAKLSTFKDKEK